MGLSAHQSARSKSDTWLTPPDWLAKLGQFDLDPCCPPNMPWRTATHMISRPEDGLLAKWSGRVWMNPPFGREAAIWLRKMRDHGDGVALVPARTETAMFYESVWGHSSGVCFVRGRPHFHFGDGTRAAFNSGAPICLVAYGRSNFWALQASGLGFVIELEPSK